jgi:hypothetical protein
VTTVLPWPAGQTPYVTPDQLYMTASGSIVATQWPVGVQYGTIPFTSGGTVSASQQFAVLSSICGEATTRAEQICGTTLRATTTTEVLEGPQFRVTVQVASGNGRIICSRWPVLAVSSVQVCPNSVWPRVWQTVPAGYYEPEFPVQGLYDSNSAAGYGEGAQSVIVAPGYITWRLRREGWRVRITYTAGLAAHSCLTADASAADAAVEVDDCTWWAPQSPGSPGAAGIIYDALAGGQETLSCTAASASAGPGTLTLAAPLNYAHAAGVMVSALPQSVIWAAAELTGASALTRGATATTIQTTAGRAQMSSPSLLDDLARKRLNAFRRTI